MSKRFPLEDLIFSLQITLGNKKIFVPTMIYFPKNSAAIYFLIPIYEDNWGLFYPGNDDDEADYADYGFLEINAMDLYNLLLKEEVILSKFVGRYKQQTELQKLLSQKKISLIFE
jgi:hypothetical protein